MHILSFHIHNKHILGCLESLRNILPSNSLKITVPLQCQAMEKLDSANVTLAQKMKEIVILMMSVKMVIFVDTTTAQFHLVLALKLTVVFQVSLYVYIKNQSG